MRKDPYSTKELFLTLKNRLQEKGLLPDNLDYAIPFYQDYLIKTIEFNLKSDLEYGSSEGIYLSFYLEIFEKDEVKHVNFGTFKTLSTSNEAMHTMATLLADFIIEENEFVNNNMDDFTWEGYSIYGIKDDGKPNSFGFYIHKKEVAVEQLNNCLKTYSAVLVKDFDKRKEYIYY